MSNFTKIGEAGEGEKLCMQKVIGYAQVTIHVSKYDPIYRLSLLAYFARRLYHYSMVELSVDELAALEPGYYVLTAHTDITFEVAADGGYTMRDEDHTSDSYSAHLRSMSEEYQAIMAVCGSPTLKAVVRYSF